MVQKELYGESPMESNKQTGMNPLIKEDISKEVYFCHGIKI